ncbi:MAG: type 1 glutamine amidotransferase [Gammaproteobacteria bacterium]|nr:type 1 glutamine amidotransferase [Gammaproteobacteria bacterium]
MKPIRIFRHAASEGPGYLAQFLDARQLPFHVIEIDRGDAVPARVDDVSALVFMGGDMSVNDALPWIADELALIRRAAQMRLPVLGHCLGGQLISKALGGRVTRNPVPEFGWFDVERVAGPVAEAWFANLPARFEVYHWHGETFSIPEGATHILRNAACAHQAFVYDRMLAMQCHIEVTAAMVREWAMLGAQSLQPGPTIQSAATMLEDVAGRSARLHHIADALYTRWLEAF